MDTNTFLPYHRRIRESFEESFGLPAGGMLSRMNSSGDDVPLQAPKFAIPIPSVGIERSHVPVVISDPFGSATFVQTSCELKVMATVPTDRRGLHMSRIGDLIARGTKETYPNIQSFALWIAEEMKKAQYGGPVDVSIVALVSYLEDVPGLERNKLSLENLELTASVSTLSGRLETAGGLRVSHMVACPCVQLAYRHTRATDGWEEAGPLFTHSQRAVTSLEIAGLQHELCYPTLLDALDRVLCRTQNTLPRDLELQLVYRSHRQPQFIEDAVRDVLAAAGCWAQTDDDNVVFRVNARSAESIHDFDLIASAEISARELSRVISQANSNGRS